MCERLDIKSCKETEKLKKAKDEVYLKGFYEGVMLVGECKGMKVCDAKPILRKVLIDNGEAISYYEPESMVVSRTGDECVVALTDQWYLAYGDPEWAGIVSEHIHSDNFNGYNDKIMESFDHVLGWLKEWACSRPFGLGTQLPWDQQWVIESLSDSTIYMAYYTIAHHFHGSVDNLGSKEAASPSGVKPEDLTDDVFSYIFLAKPLPVGVTTAIPEALLKSMQEEFEYWYPFDLRVSAKDLIPNHLTMSLYNHVEIWKDRPKFWPKGIYCNGHIMVDAEKMAKSKGNFLMLKESVDEYSADAIRFAMADAGDSMEDANFDRSVANGAVTYLYIEEESTRLILEDFKADTLREGEYTFMDKVFNNEMDYLIEGTFNDFEKMCYRDGIHKCWFDMLIARDMYRDWALKCNIPMHKEVIMRFLRVLTVMMTPITPHWCEHMWGLLGEGMTVCDAAWPAYEPYNKLVRKEYIFFRDFLKNIRLAFIKVKLPPVGDKCTMIYLASIYEEKKVIMLHFLQSICTHEGTFPSDLMGQMKTFCEADSRLSAFTKPMMQFGAFMRNEAEDRGTDALQVEMAFSQKDILEENIAYIKAALGIQEVLVVNTENGPPPGEVKKANLAAPGKPSYHFYSK
jgi:leucyl-tRNA synthetase